jgi:glycosyltransferase involved in cell wall biosynthesis
MKILFTVTSLLPRYGGPAFSVSGLATALAEAGAEVGVWASDQSAAATSLLRAHSSVQRLAGSEVEAINRFGVPDVIHDNGIWRPHNHRIARLAVRRRVRRVLSTRGMLEPWALDHKRLKKKVAWALFQEKDLASATCHHATAEEEAQNVRNLGLGVPVVVIPNGVNLPQVDTRDASSQSTQRTKKLQRTALFLSRIHPKKGLPMLIEAWARVRPDGWTLQIAGPDEAGHQKEIERAVAAAGLGNDIVFKGQLQGQLKDAAFSQADIFVLPTHSENFGVVVAEALAHGVPVLTTNRAPWPTLSTLGCGWRVDATVDGIAEGLRLATSLDSERLLEMGAKGRSFVSAEFGWPRIASLMLSTYEDILKEPFGRQLPWHSVAAWQFVR